LVPVDYAEIGKRYIAFVENRIVEAQDDVEAAANVIWNLIHSETADTLFRESPLKQWLSNNLQDASKYCRIVSDMLDTMHKAFKIMIEKGEMPEVAKTT
jgi:hypothetical protein